MTAQTKNGDTVRIPNWLIALSVTIGLAMIGQIAATAWWASKIDESVTTLRATVGDLKLDVKDVQQALNKVDVNSTRITDLQRRIGSVEHRRFGEND